MTIIDDRAAQQYVVHAAGFPAQGADGAPSEPPPTRSTRRYVVGWVLVGLALLGCMIAVYLLGSPDASAAGGCGGG